MGLLDNLLMSANADYGGQQGGLLDLLRSMQSQQQQYQPSQGFPDQAPNQPSPLDTAQWPAGPNGPPATFADRFGAMPGAPPAFAPSGRSFDSAQFNPSTYAPNQAQPIAVGSNYQMPRIGSADQFAGAPPVEADDAEDVPTAAKPAQGAIPPAQAQSPGFGDRAMAGLQGFIGNAHTGPIGALLGGIGGLATGQSAMGDKTIQRNLTAQALLSKGASLADVQASMNDPEMRKALIAQYYGKDKYSVVKTGQNGLGQEQYRVFNPADGSFKEMPASGEGTGVSSSGLGDMNKTGAEYLATVPKAQAGILQGMVDGTIQPPSSFAMAKPYWQGMLAGAKNLDPKFDENTWTSRHKMSADIGASGNSSMGGILSNGKSSFKHLAEYTGSAADLGNASHDYPLGGQVAHAQNAIGNTLGSSATMAKIKAINDNLGHYGQESTKFYSGTGGGVEERMNALKEMNPTTTSGLEMAAYADKEKNLMLDRLREKESQIRSVMGDSYLQQHPVFTPELQADISKIEANVARLKGGQSATPTIQEGATATNPQTGQKIIFKNGKWQ